MKIHEFQAKELFRQYGIPVPEGKTAKTPEEAYEAAKSLSTEKVVVKAQIHAGGRGKGALTNNADINGVKLVGSPDAAKEHALALLGNPLATHQTGPEGQVVKQVLIEEASDIASELYAGMTLNRENGRVTFMVSTEGGMDIEKVAAETPEKIFNMSVDPAAGFFAFHGRELAYSLGLEGKTAKQAAKIFGNLFNLYIEILI